MFANSKKLSRNLLNSLDLMMTASFLFSMHLIASGGCSSFSSRLHSLRTLRCVQATSYKSFIWVIRVVWFLHGPVYRLLYWKKTYVRMTDKFLIMRKWPWYRDGFGQLSNCLLRQRKSKLTGLLPLLLVALFYYHSLTVHHYDFIPLFPAYHTTSLVSLISGIL